MMGRGVGAQAEGRMATVLLDNAEIHTPQGGKVVREALQRHGDRLRLVPTPASDPPRPIPRGFSSGHSAER
jgi:hypothetical protein